MHSELPIALIVAFCCLLAIFKRQAVKKNYVILYVVSVLAVSLYYIDPIKVLLLIATSTPLLYLLKTKNDKIQNNRQEKPMEKVLLFLMISPLFGSLFFLDNEMIKKRLSTQGLTIQGSFFPETIFAVITCVLLISRVMEKRGHK